MSAKRFGEVANLYDSIRPTYPTEAIMYQLGSEPLVVADVGAGTGLLTRRLLDVGHDVIAIDPDADMLAKLSEKLPEVPCHMAPAEELPLEDGSVDAITAGQAYHWFDRDRALPEFRRVLRPGGVFAPIWNVRDEDVDWVAALTEIIGKSSAEFTAPIASEPGYFAPHFPKQDLRVFRFGHPLTPAGLSDLVRSRSNYFKAAPEQKTRIEDALDTLLSTHPDLKGKEAFDMPYKTLAFKLTA